MKIVFMAEVFTKGMGYIENILPKYFARLGAEVHVISTFAPAYHYLHDCKKTFDGFIDVPEKQTATIESYEGFTLHRLPHSKRLGYIKMAGWYDKLEAIAPHIIQTNATIGWTPLDLAWAKPKLGYKLFTGSHRSASTFPLAQHPRNRLSKEELKCFLTRFLPGRLISNSVEKCYCPTGDSAEIAWQFFGIEKSKVEVMFLGVDTDYFYPIEQSNNAQQERLNCRQALGFEPDEIVCVYSGKMTEDKNAVILAQSIERLRAKGYKYSGLFIGNGVQRDEISRYPFCQVFDFMPYRELAPYYRAADIGVWPTNESISMLDAAACGLPLIVSDGIGYFDHVDGNGLIYKMNNLDNLVDTLVCLKDKAYRNQLGEAGSRKMQQTFSWESIAKRRLTDYEYALTKAV
jgi:glycosyltransferase involved in cell wall biosynthesis